MKIPIPWILGRFLEINFSYTNLDKPRKAKDEEIYVPPNTEWRSKVFVEPRQVRRNITIGELRRGLQTNPPAFINTNKGIIETLPRRGYLDHDCCAGHCTDNPLYGQASPRRHI